MNTVTDQRNPGLKENDRLYEYEIRRIIDLPEINSIFYELEHLPTGAKHIHISNSDTENTFSVMFKTVPVDSTGVAHILEHTALCGSVKFPVRDPFFSMLKRSLSTFMNAFTASDWTMYPFSTQNQKDFYNLMDVYLDAAFFPKLDPLNFKQEGHRLEIEGDALVYKGVVYNEMKGAMSSPSQMMGRYLLKVLYPDTTYSFNSGGEPSVIPTLTHEQLKAFHQRHYHPSNARFYTYGNLPLKPHLEFIHEKILKHFDRIDPQTDVPSQPRWNAPREASFPYPVAPSEDVKKKSQVCVAWLTADIRDTFEVLTLVLLEQILLGNAGSPLRKALIDSGLGTALSDGTGFTSDIRDTMFACGLKDVEESSAYRIQELILDVLKTLSETGIDPKLIDSAIHQIEFHRKEKTNTPYPYGIKLMLGISGTWLHGGDPIRILRFDDDLKRLHEELAKGRYFENRIRQYFIDNPHRVLFKLVPDPHMEQQENERVQQELNQKKAAMNKAQLETIQNDANALKALQESEEDLSVLPTLALEEIPPKMQRISESRLTFLPQNLTLAAKGVKLGHFPISVYEQPTSGIFYFSMAAGIGMVPAHLIPYIPFFCHAFSKVGTAQRDYTEMAWMIDAYTGGVGLSAHARTRYEPSGQCLPFVILNGKCLVRNQSRMFDILHELIYEFNFSNLIRLKNLLLEYQAGMESVIVENGHRLAMSLASRKFSATQALNEAWSGIHQLKTIKTLTQDLREDKLQVLAENLTAIAQTLFIRSNLKIALIGETSALSSAVVSAASLQDGLPVTQQHGFTSPPIVLDSDMPREGWSTSTAVSFVAKTFKTIRLEHEDAPVLTVISKLLRSLYLHREIREKGGAYGGFATYNSEDGVFGFGSYRDPHIVTTLNVYDRAETFIKSGSFTHEDIKEAILQVCSEIDRPDPPGPAARKAFYRKLISLSDDVRDQYKSRLLAVNRDQILAAAERYFGPHQPYGVAVISSEERLKAASEQTKLKLYRI